MKNVWCMSVFLFTLCCAYPKVGTVCAMATAEGDQSVSDTGLCDGARMSLLEWITEQYPPKHTLLVVWSEGWCMPRELNPTEFAERAEALGIYGFQGCVNKERCHNYGCYLQEYSREGLCRTCEIEQYPERYGNCYFCDVLTRKSDVGIDLVCCPNCLEKLLKMTEK